MATFIYYPFDDAERYRAVLRVANALGWGGLPPAQVAADVGAILNDTYGFMDDLHTVTDGDDLIIHGHGAIGLKVLGSVAEPMVMIDQSTIADNLVACGLSETATCKIYLLGCYTGEGQGRSLASMLATRLSQMKPKYLSCNDVWGTMFKAILKSPKAKNHDSGIHNDSVKLVKGGKKEHTDMGAMHMDNRNGLWDLYWIQGQVNIY